MSYTLVTGSLEGSPKYHNQLKSLAQTLIKFPYQVILIKHHQNFYDQDSSYFIIIEERWQKDIQRKNIRIRKQIIQSPALKQQTNESDKNEEKKHSDDKKTYQIQCYVDDIEFSFQRVLAGNFIYENAILVLKDPFQLFFLTEKSKKPIKIVLDQEYNLSEITAYFSFETNEQQKKKEPFLLTIYGFDNNDHRNKILSVNLLTFDVKQIQQSKQYSPKPRKNHFKTFHDDRLYVFGGQIKQSKQTEQLLWSFDMEKGYWFALEMKYAEELKMYESYSSTVYESGKIVIFKNGCFFLLQIYQCKVSQIEMGNSSQLDLEALLRNKEILGLFTFEKNILFYTKSQILPLTLKLQKSSQLKSFKKKENQKQLNQID